MEGDGTSRVHALFKFAFNPYGGVVIDTTSGLGEYRDLSPFVLPASPARNFENLWQFSKVYPKYTDVDGNPTPEWFKWRQSGFADKVAHRYPMGKGKIPLYSYWEGEKLGYIEARKRIYAPIYAKYVVSTEGYRLAKEIYESGQVLVLRDYDAYDHIKLGLSLQDVINDPHRKMGHAFVILMLLTDELERCLR